MKINFRQEKLKWNFKYEGEVEGGNTFKAEANRTILPTQRIAKIFYDDKTMIELKEIRLIQKFLKRIPVLNIVLGFFLNRSGERYFIYKDDCKIGEIEEVDTWKLDLIKVSYNNRNYVIYHQPKGRLDRFYMFEGKTQLGFIDKAYVTEWNAQEYEGVFKDDTDELFNIMVMLFIDLCKYTEDISDRLSSQSWEYTISSRQNKDVDVVFDDEFDTTVL